MGHELEQGIFPVPAMLSPEDDEDVILAVADQAVSEDSPNEVDQPLVPVHASQEEGIRLRARIFELEQLGIILGQAGVQEVILRPSVMQLPRPQIDNANGARKQIILEESTKDYGYAASW